MQFVLYTRVSTEEQGHSRNGLEAQLAALQGFVSAGGHEVLAHYEEVASGALGLSDRLQLRLALAQARQSKAVLLVSRLDRLSRSVALISSMMAEAVPFATVEDGLDCQPFMLHVKAAMAEHERHLISVRTRAALQAKKARGEPLGHHTHKSPTTMDKARVRAVEVRRAQADAFAMQVVPMMRALRAGGASMLQVAQHLNSQGVATPRGGKWHASTVCNTLARVG